MRYATLEELPSHHPLERPADRIKWVISLVTLTPIMGGSPNARRIDDVDFVRAPSIRGQLRFWWRALYAGQATDSEDLYRREREIWGGIGGKPNEVAASQVRVSVEIDRIVAAQTEVESANIELGQPDAYALWPARGTKDEDPAPRRAAGLQFKLCIELPFSLKGQVQRTVRACILFGGLGGRTRRGCGAVAPATEADRQAWLPESMTRETLAEFLGPEPRHYGNVSSVHDARYQIGTRQVEAQAAWYSALEWLREFRQGCNRSARDVADVGSLARMRPVVGTGAAGRPGRSRWPEADKIRQHYGPQSFDHQPLAGHGPQAVWPRAQFGLPIQFQFQRRERPGSPPYPKEPPPNVMLVWSPDGDPQKGSDRLASALIVKPVALRSGEFVPLALWLHRDLPNEAKVGIQSKSTDKISLKAGSAAPLQAVRAPNDKDLFLPMSGHNSVRDAFMTWVGSRPGVKVGGVL